MDEQLLEKYEKLKDYFKQLGKVAVAFSSGVDSTFLLYAASQAIPGQVIALTAVSYLFPKRERKEATEFCEKLQVPHVIVQADELKVEGFAQNPANRCYLCKKDLFTAFMKEAKSRGYDVVAEGSNLDDLGDYRPGLQAIAELKIKSPLREVGFTKKEIRALLAYFQIPTATKPSFACLASRFPYGETITEEKLAMVDQAEQYLLDLGFQQFRVRIHGMMARIELLPTDFPKMMEEQTRLQVYQTLKAFGFTYISLDLLGYRTGSLNEAL